MTDRNPYVSHVPPPIGLICPFDQRPCTGSGTPACYSECLNNRKRKPSPEYIPRSKGPLL